jgi:hypothetical protein
MARQSNNVRGTAYKGLSPMRPVISKRPCRPCFSDRAILPGGGPRERPRCEGRPSHPHSLSFASVKPAPRAASRHVGLPHINPHLAAPRPARRPARARTRRTVPAWSASFVRPVGLCLRNRSQQQTLPPPAPTSLRVSQLQQKATRVPKSPCAARLEWLLDGFLISANDRQGSGGY